MTVALRIAFVCAAMLAIALPVATNAANLPSEFTGFWVATEATDNACRKADIKEEANNIPIARIMGVDAGTVTFYETNCTLVSVKRLPNADPNDKNQVSAEADLACSGEGSRWNAKEIWHVQTIDGNKVAVVTGLKQTNYRDDKGKKQNTRSLVTRTVYFACK
jgi:hypothetical protein